MCVCVRCVSVCLGEGLGKQGFRSEQETCHLKENNNRSLLRTTPPAPPILLQVRTEKKLEEGSL